MTISTRLDHYLRDHNISYETIHHGHSNNSFGSAYLAQIPLDRLAKAVILKDHEDRKLMALVPANRKINIPTLNDALYASFQLVKEREVYRMFNDCEHGAVPPIGQAYNIRTVCDKRLDALDSVYIEAGDHENLLRLSHDDFELLFKRCHHLNFSREVFH